MLSTIVIILTLIVLLLSFINLGITRQDDKLPDIVLKPLNSGRTADVEINIDENLERYYKERGWNEQGLPTEAKLTQLNIA